MTKKITRQDAIKKLVQMDVDNADDETLYEVFEHGAPGYTSRSDLELKELFEEYIGLDTNEGFDF